MALVGYQKLGLALLVFGIGAFLVMNLVLNAALKVVGEVSAKWSQPSHHVNWQSRVTMLASLSTHPESLAKFRALLEKLRFVRRCLGGSPMRMRVLKKFST